jgi:hypothetical protein
LRRRRADTYADSHSHGNGDGDSNSHGDSDSHSNGYADSNSTTANTNSYTDSDSASANTNSYGNWDTDRAASAHPRAQRDAPRLAAAATVGCARQVCLQALAKFGSACNCADGLSSARSTRFFSRRYIRVRVELSRVIPPHGDTAPWLQLTAHDFVAALLCPFVVRVHKHARLEWKRVLRSQEP